jgi:hypothetical protein
MQQATSLKLCWQLCRSLFVFCPATKLITTKIRSHPGASSPCQGQAFQLQDSTVKPHLMLQLGCGSGMLLGLLLSKLQLKLKVVG